MRASLDLMAQLTTRPAIIKGFGYSSVNAQLLTVPPYIVAAISFIIAARLSDHMELRTPFIALAFVILTVGRSPLGSTIVSLTCRIHHPGRRPKHGRALRRGVHLRSRSVSISVPSGPSTCCALRCSSVLGPGTEPYVVGE